MKPGDLIGFETSGLFAALIRFGQRLGRVKNWRVTHIAIVDEVLADGVAWLVQAVRTVDVVSLNDAYEGVPRHVLSWKGTNEDREDILRFGGEMVGMKYGVLTVVFRAINYLTPRFVRVNGERKGRMDCSVLGARAWEHGGFVFPRDVDVWQITPGELVDRFS